LRAAGKQAWIVGGAVRDLALGRHVGDLDVATDATPDELVGLFDETHEVGRAFGTVVVVVHGVAVEVTTFRRESGYRDARHPDRVEFATSAEEDAGRRDFTVNALYLDVANDRVLDPTGGVPDLHARRLRAVGDPDQRFGEDGLRIVRLARFAATLGFDVDAATARAAERRLASLRGVSPERVRAEWEEGFAYGRGAELLQHLEALGALNASLPGLLEQAGSEAEIRRRVEALSAVEGARPFELGLAILCEPRDGDVEAATALVAGLRPSRDQARAVRELWALCARLDRACEERDVPRSVRVRLAREPRIDLALRGRRALLLARGRSTDALDALRAELERLTPGELDEAPWITARELQAAGIRPGPRFGELLSTAETLQLDRALPDRDAALRWLSSAGTSDRARD